MAPPATCSPADAAMKAMAHATESRATAGIAASQSLNTDPFNVMAEELALEDCMHGKDVRRTWSEQQMVRSLGGQHFPGTPDGMFETWDGVLTCVQVVRVPLVAEMSPAAMKQTLAHTVLVKVVKSQTWLRASHYTPQEFVIFCWLPFCIPADVARHAEELMEQVKEVDPRFSLRLRVPPKPGELFPAKFACNHDLKAQMARMGYSWSDVATYNPSDDVDEEDDDYECEFDIWEDDFIHPSDAAAPDLGGSEEAADSPPQPPDDDDDDDDDQEVEYEWDVAWPPEETGETFESSAGDKEGTGAGVCSVHAVSECKCFVHEGRSALDDSG